jgi:hypothetical protein
METAYILIAPPADLDKSYGNVRLSVQHELFTNISHHRFQFSICPFLLTIPIYAPILRIQLILWHDNHLMKEKLMPNVSININCSNKDLDHIPASYRELLDYQEIRQHLFVCNISHHCCNNEKLVLTRVTSGIATESFVSSVVSDNKLFITYVLTYCTLLLLSLLCLTMMKLGRPKQWIRIMKYRVSRESSHLLSLDAICELPSTSTVYDMDLCQISNRRTMEWKDDCWLHCSSLCPGGVRSAVYGYISTELYFFRTLPSNISPLFDWNDQYQMIPKTLAYEITIEKHNDEWEERVMTNIRPQPNGVNIQAVIVPEVNRQNDFHLTSYLSAACENQNVQDACISSSVHSICEQSVIEYSKTIEYHTVGHNHTADSLIQPIQGLQTADEENTLRDSGDAHNVSENF